METKLDLISLRAKKGPAYRFESLAHLLNEGFLEQCYRGLGRNKAAGVDGVSWQEYGEKLDENLKGLVVRLKAKQYRPLPARRVYISKDEHSERPLGIPVQEDKVVGKGISRILEAIYEQDLVDEEQKEGLFILTGSQQLLLLDTITQSLAGRTALLTLYPLSLAELHKNNIARKDLHNQLSAGGYPRIYDRKLNPAEWCANYIATYVERDVRSIKNVGDLSTFTRFIKMCAARSGQLLNLSELGNDCGINHNTAKSWLSVLEASFIIFLLQPHFVNFNKRLIKSPKLYFLDTGVLCYLLNIRDPAAIVTSPHRGQIFETFVMGELVKYYANRGMRAPLYFWRDKTGHEIDCIVDENNKLIPIEIKSGETITGDFFKNLNFWKSLANSQEKRFVVYVGDRHQKREQAEVVSWNALEILCAGLAAK